MPAWLLPDHTSDQLPAEALQVERLRRRLIDLYGLYGYALFQPPLLEYVESLRVQGADDLDRRSFRLTDPLSGRQLSLRADITPQAARVDAHLLGQSGVSRLCYAAPAIHALPAGLLSSREPLQVGCELFGHEGLDADLEIQELALASLDAAGLQNVHINLTDRAIFAALCSGDSGVTAVEGELLSALQSKDRPRLDRACEALRPATRSALQELVSLYGPVTGTEGVLDRARRVLPQTDAVLASLNRLERVAQSALYSRHPHCQITIDLADLQGWRYHNGIMFSAFVSGYPDALVRGGRYDGMGEAFGRSRAATGFSLELRALSALSVPSHAGELPVAAPWEGDAELHEAVAHARAQGRAVVFLPESEFREWSGPRMVRTSGLWQVAPAPSSSMN